MMRTLVLARERVLRRLWVAEDFGGGSCGIYRGKDDAAPIEESAGQQKLQPNNTKHYHMVIGVSLNQSVQ